MRRLRGNKIVERKKLDAPLRWLLCPPQVLGATGVRRVSGAPVAKMADPFASLAQQQAGNCASVNPFAAAPQQAGAVNPFAQAGAAPANTASPFGQPPQQQGFPPVQPNGAGQMGQPMQASPFGQPQQMQQQSPFGAPPPQQQVCRTHGYPEPHAIEPVSYVSSCLVPVADASAVALRCAAAADAAVAVRCRPAAFEPETRPHRNHVIHPHMIHPRRYTFSRRPRDARSSRASMCIRRTHTKVSPIFDRTV